MSNFYDRPLPLPDALVDEFQYGPSSGAGDGLFYYPACDWCEALGAEECMGHKMSDNEWEAMGVDYD